MKPAYPIAYRDEIVETQGKLFGRFQCDHPDADGEDFITAYLCGETRSRIDNAAAILSNMTPAELQDEFMTQEGYQIRAGHSLDPFAADWIGQFYAYYQWQTGERSRDIIKRIPTKVMRVALAAELERVRVKKGITQAQLAAKMGTKQSGVARMTSHPEATTLNNLIKGLVTLGEPIGKIAACLLLCTGTN